MKKTKFFKKVIAALAIVSMTQYAAAQQQVLFEENFDTKSLDTAKWDLKNSTLISEKVGYLYFLTTDGINWSGSYIYDPNGVIVSGGIQQELKGNYELNTRSIVLPDTTVAISCDIFWKAQFASDKRNFGIRICEAGGEWDTITELKNASGIMPASYEKSFIQVLDRKYSGKEVKIGFFFNNEDNTKYAYYSLLDNLKMEIVAASDRLILTNDDAPYIMKSNGKEKIEYAVTNKAADIVYTARFARRFNEGTIDTLDVDFGSNGLEFVAIRTGYTVEINEDVVVGQWNELRLWPVMINEKAVSNIDTFEYDFLYYDENMLNAGFVSLLECFTASWCDPCASLNAYLNDSLANLRRDGLINVVKYQGDGYETDAYEERGVYYGVTGIPTPVYNGTEVVTAWANNYIVMMNELRRKATLDAAQKALLAFKVNKADVDKDSEQLTLDISVIAPFDLRDITLFASVIERTTRGNRGSNGETEFHWVDMGMPTTASGLDTLLRANDTLSLHYVVDMKQTHVEEIEDLEVVLFAQHLGSGKILQSYTARVTVNGEVPTLDNETLTAMNVAMYPNPARDEVHFAGLNNAQIEVYDLMGHRLYVKSGVRSDLTLDLKGFSEGVYVVRIVQNGQVSSGKLMVVR